MATYVKIRDGEPVWQRQLTGEGSVIADYGSDDLLLGIEVLSPIEVKIDGDDAIKAIDDLGWLQHDRASNERTTSQTEINSRQMDRLHADD